MGHVSYVKSRAKTEAADGQQNTMFSAERPLAQYQLCL